MKEKTRDRREPVSIPSSPQSYFGLDDEGSRLAQKYEDALDPALEESLYERTLLIGHDAKHMGQAPEEVMDDMLRNFIITKGQRPRTRNGFASAQSAREDIIDGMYSMAWELAAWRTGQHGVFSERQRMNVDILMNRKSAFTNPHAVLSLDGPAFVQTEDDISPTRNTTLHLTLEPKNYEYGGFNNITSYPMTDLSLVPDTPADLTDLIRKTGFYKDSEPLMKTILEYKGALKPEDRPRAYPSCNANAFIVEAQKGLPDGETPKFYVYDDANVKFRGPDANGRWCSTNVDASNERELRERYPDAMNVVMPFSKRVKELRNDFGQPQAEKAPYVDTREERLRRAEREKADGRRNRSYEGIRPVSNDKRTVRSVPYVPEPQRPVEPDFQL